MVIIYKIINTSYLKNIFIRIIILTLMYPISTVIIIIPKYHINITIPGAPYIYVIRTANTTYIPLCGKLTRFFLFSYPSSQTWTLQACRRSYYLHNNQHRAYEKHYYPYHHININFSRYYRPYNMKNLMFFYYHPNQPILLFIRGNDHYIKIKNLQIE